MLTRAHRPYFIVHDGIRMDLLKALYQAMLVELPPGEVAAFWKRHPIVLFKGPLPLPAFLRFLWSGYMSVEAGYFWAVLEDLDALLGARRIDKGRFYRLLNQSPEGGPPLDPGWVLKTLHDPRTGKPDFDPREWLLSGLDRLLAALLPGCRVERIPPGRDGHREGSSLFLFRPSRDREATGPDFRSFPGLLIKELPRLFGRSPFSALEVLADMRGPGRILGDGGEWNWKGEALHRGRKRLGRLVRMQEFADARHDIPELARALGAEAGRLVVLMERDFQPAGAPHPVLQEGCAYGAPFTLFRIGYSPNPAKRWSRLANVLYARSLPADGTWNSWKSASILHLELLASEERPRNPS